MCTGTSRALPARTTREMREVQKFRLTQNPFHLPGKSKFFKSVFCIVFPMKFSTKSLLLKCFRHLIRPGGHGTWPKAAVSLLFINVLFRPLLTVFALLTQNVAHGFEGQALFFLFVQAEFKNIRKPSASGQKTSFLCSTALVKKGEFLNVFSNRHKIESRDLLQSIPRTFLHWIVCWAKFCLDLHSVCGNKYVQNLWFFQICFRTFC